MNSILARLISLISSWKGDQPHQPHQLQQFRHRQLTTNTSASLDSLFQELPQRHNGTTGQSQNQNTTNSSGRNDDELIDLTTLCEANDQSSDYYYAIEGDSTNSSSINRTSEQFTNHNESHESPTDQRQQQQQQQLQIQERQPQSNRRLNLFLFNLGGQNPGRTSTRTTNTTMNNQNNNNNNMNNMNNQSIRTNLTNNLASRLTSATLSSTSSSTSSGSSSTATSGVNFDLFANGKKRERNLLAACCSIFCIAVLGVSLIETRWFYMNGGGCNLNYIGVAHFFAPGRLEMSREFSKITKSEIDVYHFILPNGIELKNCANRQIMVIMRLVIAFVFLAIFSSCIGLMLDTLGCMRSGVKLVRRHAIFHILTVIICLSINGFCFWISENMYAQQSETRSKKGKKIEVAFDVSYYLIVLASGLSILATAFTLIRRYPTDEDDQLERLLEEYTSYEEPLLHLERSLPAVQQQQQQQTTSTSTFPHAQSLLVDQCATNQSQLYNTSLASAIVPSYSSSSSTSNPIHNNTHLASNSQTPLNVPQPQSQPPPPPTTPPPSVHFLSSSAYQPVVISEPPPPYDPTPTIV